ncbi:hypothetical protein F511_38564 [Dorcoceras hygrometricum]|uniref:Uncharacterized protein n=1 Tax=Dorcoceras hygrometricum TaxID=472368 RepID=A0A2Z7CCT5_9LAMI|nr:hypothetical protein F511_38564 [Dorcoceras hygrometricum]
MTPSSSMKVRLVRCPRCRQVLAELPDVSVYRCGGCGTILQAKHCTKEANNTVNSVTKTQLNTFPEEEEARNSNLDFPGPPLEESSPDKDGIGFQDEAAESSSEQSEQSEYRSAYNGLCSSPEFSRDTGECSLRHDSQIYDSKSYDSDEDSTGAGKFFGEFPSSMEANEQVKEHDNIYLDPSTKVDQSDGEKSPKAWQGGEKFMDEVLIFCGCEDQDSQQGRVHTARRERIDDNYAHLEHDTVSEKEAINLNHFSSQPEEESSSDKDSRNVSHGLLSIPGAGLSEREDSTLEESVIHGKVKCCLGIDSERYVRESHDSDRDSTTGGNFSGEIPSSSELVYQGIDESVIEAKWSGKDEKIHSDQPPKRDQCDDVEFPDHEDQDNGWPPFIAQHMEGTCNCNVNLENNDVLPEEARNLNHCLGCQHEEEVLPDKESIRYHDTRMESSTKLSEDRSICNGFLSLPEVKVFQNKDTDDSLYHDNSQDLKISNSGLLDLGKDEESFPEEPKKMGQSEGGESLRMFQKSDYIRHKVENISEHEAQENGLSTVSTKHREDTNNHAHLAHENASKEVAEINKHGEGININHVRLESDNVSKEVARNHAHLENDDVSKGMAGILNHNSTSPPKEELSLDKTNIRFQDEHVESKMEFAVVRSVSNDLSTSRQVNCCQNVDPHMEESLDKDQDGNSLATHFERHDNELHDLDVKLSGGGNLSGDIHSSTELVYHETEELISEAIEHAKECNRSNSDQPMNLEPVQVENSLQVCPEDDNLLYEVQNFSGHEGKRRAGVGSSTETVSHEDDYASPIDDGFKGSPTINRTNTNNPSVGDTVIASQVVSLGMPTNLTSFGGKHVDSFPRKGSRMFGSASSVELVGDSLFSETSPERRVKPQDTTNLVTTRGYYAYDGSESSNDETDGQIPVYFRHSSRRKGKEVGYSSTTLKRESIVVKSMMSSEPEMEYWVAPSPSNQQHTRIGNHGNSDELAETKSRSPNNGNAIRLNEGGSSWLPHTSKHLHANQRLRGHSVQRNNLPPLHPGFHSPDRTSHSEPDKLDLLRTVCELKDQLNRIQFPKISRDGRLPAGVTRETFSLSPLYYDHLTPGRERGVDLNHHGNYQWYDHENGRIEQSNVSALPLSAKAAYYRHHVYCSCLHCRTRDWHSSAPLLPHSSHYNDRSVASIGHNSHNISSPLSSQIYSGNESLVQGRDTMFDDQSRIDNEMRRFYLRDKYHASKRHLRPVAGGSPFVICSHCSETLQLPADFLVFKKKYHQLRCNACSKVLKFSLKRGNHIVPYLSRALEVGDSTDATNERSLLVMPHSNFCQHGEPVSCSDDYGQSFGRSCSTEGGALGTVPSSGLVKKNMYSRMISSMSSYEATENRKMKFIMRNSMEKAKSKNKKKTLVETSKPFGTSSEQPKFVKSSPEIEELPPSPNSPLHRLMGYSSISQVLNKGRT